MNTDLEASHIQHRIFWIRGHGVMVDADLAQLYGVMTKNLNKAVHRNLIRFPSDFMFQLTDVEAENLRFQFGTSNWGGRRYQPFVFTEQGVAMLSSVLRSRRAAMVNIAIMRAFVRVRNIFAHHRDLTKKLEELERQMTRQEGRSRRHSRQIRMIFEAIQSLIQNQESSRQRITRRVGFRQ